MIQSNSTLDIFVNGQRVDILNRSSINLRINNVVYNPTEINSTQAEYSFSFNLPTTPTNNKIFDYANELAKVNKFKNTYNSEVYVDGVLIFSGSLRIQSIKKGFYNVNLVNIKINTVEDIFGDMVLSDLRWTIPFTGTNSINTYNADQNSKVTFPLVSYGVFQKRPSSTEYDYDNYTSKFQIDKYNKWYYESFNPSPNLLELVVRLFRQKGFEVRGNVFQDPVIPNLFMSTNLDDQQIPTYNLGYPNMGQATIACQFTNYMNKNTGATRTANYLQQQLSYPYLGIGSEFNFDAVNIYDLWSEENTAITTQSQHFLFDEGSNCIVVPATGLYKIRLEVDCRIPTQTVTGSEYKYNSNGDTELVAQQLNNSLQDDMPIEIQLVKNEDACELIHGAYQWNYTNGDRAQKYSWLTAYPHENLYGSTNPTESVARFRGRTSRRGSTGFGAYRGDRVPSRNPNTNNTHRVYNGYFGGYMPKPGEFLAYDPSVNENFIIGISSLSSGTASVIKNGYGWQGGEKNDSRYNCSGYWSSDLPRRGKPETTYTKTDFNKNVLLEDPSVNINITDTQMTGTICAIVSLNRNDILMLKALVRSWYSVQYKFEANVNVQIEAYSPRSIESIESQGRTWNSPSQFDIDLNIGEFLNNKTKASDFINNFLKEFNLSFVNEGNIVYLNTQQLGVDKNRYALNLDGRVKGSDGESKLIDYPSSMEIKYKIDTEEWGFETTVPPDQLNEANWADYGDYGYDKIVINDRNDETGDSIQLSTSYCYYDTFKILNDSDEEIGQITIPVISKFSYMIDGYSYAESMKVDGKGLPLRYWFRGKITPYTVLVNGKYPVNLYDTVNEKDGYSLSYHQKEGTLLTRYFNIYPDLSSNYVSIKCYLTSEEYKLLKGGCNVVFDSDIYIVGEIQGYDAMGLNETELLLIKKK